MSSHCHSESEAKALLAAIGGRLNECKLDMHSEKSGIVYCKDGRRSREYLRIQTNLRRLERAGLAIQRRTERVAELLRPLRVLPAAGESVSAVPFARSHCVDVGNGIPSPSCSFSTRLKGRPVPYLSMPTMAPQLASYFSSPTPSGAAAVYTSPHSPQRSRVHSYTVACSGAIACTRTNLEGSLIR